MEGAAGGASRAGLKTGPYIKTETATGPSRSLFGLAIQFDIFPDGTFAMVEADPNAQSTQIDVVLNWVEEPKRLLPSD